MPESIKHFIILQHFIFTSTLMHLNVISFRLLVVRSSICCLTPTPLGGLGSQPHGCVARRVCRPSKRAEITLKFPLHLSFMPLEKLSLTTERSNSPETGVVFHSGLQDFSKHTRHKTRGRGCQIHYLLKLYCSTKIHLFHFCGPALTTRGE